MGITIEDYVRAVAKGVRAGMSKVLVLEPQTGNWVNQNLWGDQRFAPLPGDAGAVVQVLGKNTLFYGPPAVHSIQLGRSDEVNAGNADVRARISYGCGGARNSFDVDWVHGAQFSIVCNTVSVDAVTYAPISGLPYDAASASVALVALVTKGTVAQGRCPATYTEPQRVLANAPDPASFVTLPFPDFAREVTVHLANNNDPATPTGVTLTFLNSGAQEFAVYDGQVCAGGRSIPIPGGSNLLKVSNASGGPLITTVEWFLGL